MRYLPRTSWRICGLCTLKFSLPQKFNQQLLSATFRNPFGNGFTLLSKNSSASFSSLSSPTSLQNPTIEHTLNSVVKIYTVTVSPNYIQPWCVKPQKDSSGSGFAIEG
eukprot:Sdes_comp24982_c0_seq1m22624